MPKWNDGRFMDNEVDGKNVLKGVAWKLAERIAAKLVELVVSLVLARILSPEYYGMVAMVMVFIAIADVFITSGFSAALIQKKNADSVDFSTMFYCSLACSILIYIIVFGAAPFISAFYKEESLCLLVRVFALKIPLSVYNSIQHAYVSRHMMFKRFFWSTLLGTVVSGIIGIILAYKGAGVWALVAQYFINMIIDTVVLKITVPWKLKKEFSVERAKSLLAYGWKILVADLSGTFFNQLKSLLIGRYYTKSDLAYYNKGQQFPELLYSNISIAVSSVMFPAIANYSDDCKRVKYVTRKAVRILSYIIMPLLLGMAAVSDILIPILLTDKWQESVVFVKILCIDYVITSVAVVPFQAIKAIGQSNSILKMEIIKKPIYVILLVIGIKTNVYMVAVVMVIYDVYGSIVNSVLVRKYISYSYKEQLADILPSLAISVAMAAVVFMINPTRILIINLIVKLVVGVIVYLLISVIMKAKPLKEISNMIGNR